MGAADPVQLRDEQGMMVTMEDNTETDVAHPASVPPEVPTGDPDWSPPDPAGSPPPVRLTYNPFRFCGSYGEG